MNSFMYPIPNNYQQQIIEQLIHLNHTLKKIEEKIDTKNVKNENNYLEKDDNYYMI